MDISYEELVIKGIRVRESHDRNNWEFGDLADLVATRWGDKTLENYAEDIGISYNHLKVCRSVSRAWPSHNRRPKTWSVAKSLMSLKPNAKYHILDISPNMTVKEAIIHMDMIKKYKSTGKYRDVPIHEKVSILYKKLNPILAKHSEEWHLVKEIAQYEAMDAEYMQKIHDLIFNLRTKADDALEILFNAKYKRPPKEIDK